MTRAPRFGGVQRHPARNANGAGKRSDLDRYRRHVVAAYAQPSETRGQGTGSSGPARRSLKPSIARGRFERGGGAPDWVLLNGQIKGIPPLDRRRPSSDGRVARRRWCQAWRGDPWVQGLTAFVALRSAFLRRIGRSVHQVWQGCCAVQAPRSSPVPLPTFSACGIRSCPCHGVRPVLVMRQGGSEEQTNSTH